MSNKKVPIKGNKQTQSRAKVGTPGSRMLVPQKPAGMSAKSSAECAALAECARDYVLARCDPFHAGLSSACCFGKESTPSFRYKTSSVLTVVLSSIGSNWLIWRPSAANDASEFAYKGNLSPTTFGDVHDLTLAPGLASPAAKGSPFTIAQFGDGTLEARLVGAGLVMENTTNDFTAQGAYTYMSTLDRNGWNATDNVDILINDQCTQLKSAKGQNKARLHFIPTVLDTAEVWRTIPYPPTSAVGDCIGAIKIDPQSSTGTAIIHTVAYWEVRGATVRGMTHPAPASTTLFSKMFSAIVDVVKGSGHFLPSSETLVRMVLQRTGIAVSNSNLVEGLMYHVMSNRAAYGITL